MPDEDAAKPDEIRAPTAPGLSLDELHALVAQGLESIGGLTRSRVSDSIRKIIVHHAFGARVRVLVMSDAPRKVIRVQGHVYRYPPAAVFTLETLGPVFERVRAELARAAAGDDEDPY